MLNEGAKSTKGHSRTTVMLRNLPPEYTRDVAVSILYLRSQWLLNGPPRHLLSWGPKPLGGQGALFFQKVQFSVGGSFFEPTHRNGLRAPGAQGAPRGPLGPLGALGPLGPLGGSS